MKNVCNNIFLGDSNLDKYLNWFFDRLDDESFGDVRDAYNNDWVQFAVETFEYFKGEVIKKGICLTCGNPILGFNDNLSRREFGISGMCQNCQDKVFG